ncbi:MAG: DUF4396 domain-containing protein [Candidatus Pelagibacterales bacterium]|jgi:hypothetical protein|tara:strand:+ start:746 stop:1171 length:426 start_codon:yes stop_codon:yes gene_type:complete
MNSIKWNCKHTWKESAHNTMWCLIGCSIGDFGTIFYFQSIDHTFPIYLVMAIAIINGLLTSILLETLILLKKMTLGSALSTAFGMSLISMISMEVAMNLIDIIFAKGVLTWWVIPMMLAAGFLTPWPYNYWRLKKYGVACH